MGRIYCKIIIVSICLLANSCSFDPPDGKLLDLGKGYFVSYNQPMSNEGIEIKYLFKQNLYQTVASNCINIYSNSSTIVFEKNLYLNDSLNYEYYLIDKNSKNELKKLSKSIFEKMIISLEKIEFQK